MYDLGCSAEVVTVPLTDSRPVSPTHQYHLVCPESLWFGVCDQNRSSVSP